jgi:hypothetical protein
MAIRVHLRPLDADNFRGSLPAARNDWRSGHADSMSARDNTIPLQMPDIRLQAKPARPFKIDLISYLREESIYQLLGPAVPTFKNSSVLKKWHRVLPKWQISGIPAPMPTIVEPEGRAR